MKACMGGWCLRRDTCKHYTAESHEPPDERLCIPEQDGTMKQLTNQSRAFTPKGFMRDLVLTHLRTMGTKGAGVDDMVAMLGRDAESIGNAVRNAQRDGLVVGVYDYRGGKANTRKQWFLAELAPAGPLNLPPAARARAGEVVIKADALDPKAPAIVPPNVKVTVAPPFVDRRFYVELPRGGGQITRDWRERRMQELHA